MTGVERALPPAAQRVVLRHSALTRICHWINALCFFALLMSGLQIFNAHPALNFGQTTDFARPLLSLAPNRFPSWATLPEAQDLAVGRRWHFFFAWALVLNGAVYLGDLLLRGRIRRLWPSASDLKSIPRAIVDHARLRFPKGDDALSYNVLQKLAYLAAVGAFPLLILAGLTMSPAMDAAFPWLARRVRRPAVGARRPLPARQLPGRIRRRPSGDGRSLRPDQQRRIDVHRPLPHRGGRP